jgi:pyruvate dehydrogenase E2 component (dihydrolipoamide acetyltransferase)
MAKPVIMPRLGQSVESCTIARWLKKKGDNIVKGEVLLSYETDKASFDLEAEDDGLLLEIFYNDGDEVPVLGNIAVIGNAGEPTGEFRPQGAAKSEVLESPASREQPVKPETRTIKSDSQETAVIIEPIVKPDGKINISPRARNLAEKLNVYYFNLRGSGPQGRIIERDVQTAALNSPRLTPTSADIIKETRLAPGASGSGMGGRITEKDLTTAGASTGDFEVVKLSNIRKLIAKGMYNSLQNSAQLTHHMGADARNILALREDIKKKMKEGSVTENITLNDMVCMAVIKALKKNNYANAHFLGDSIKMFKNVNLGFAVDTERGLLVPCLKNADRFTLAGLSAQLKELAAKAKAGNIDPDLISPEAATFTVSNLGAYGVEMFTPVINLPQVGILGVNTIISRPADLGNGAFGFIPFIGLSLTYDHRAIDGGPASLFLKAIKTEIENFPSSYSQI